MTNASSAGHRGALRLSVVEGMLHAVMLGASESYLGALAVELGHRDRALALLATVPLLAGALAQLSSPFFARMLPRRVLVAGGALLQALMVLGLLWIARGGERELWPFLLAKTGFWVLGAVIIPPWSAWMADLTEGGERERYFAMRSAFISVGLLGAFVASGAWLHGSGRGTLLAYSDLFAAAFVARAASALCLALQHDPQKEGHTGVAPLGEALRRGRWRVPLYMAVLMFGSHVSVPFFTPYMLRTLELDYGQYTMLLSIAIVAKAVAFPLCHGVALRIGMARSLTFAGIGVGLTPTLWFLAGSVEDLMLVEAFGGTVWAMWEYATFQLLLSASDSQHRLGFLSVAGTITAAAQLAGALAGTALLEALELSYPQVFLISSALRLLALAVLVIQLRHLLPERSRLRRLAVRLMTVRPNAGAAVRPVERDDA